MSKRRELLERIEELNKEINELRKENEHSFQRLHTYERSFLTMQTRIDALKRWKRKGIRFVRSIGAYLLGRRNVKHLYSKSFKIKNAINQLKPYKYYLYDLGFIEATLKELKKKLSTTEDKYLRRAILWELGLWYANEQTNFGAKRSLLYLYEFMREETDQTLLRQGTILLVESLNTLGYQADAKLLLEALLKEQKHPDIYFAMANLHSNIDEKLHWMNKAFNYYNLAEITFCHEGDQPTYEDLRTKLKEKRSIAGPKVSVILPAYNAAEGIQVAIESILQQTYQNIELLIVDDCSTDDTLKVIQTYAKKDDRIRWFQTPKNSGPYVARNIGLKHATGKYVTVNDADDWSHAEKLERQVDHLEENESIIANTSEHARLTEALQFHRRGTPGNYIFSNMSSLMFRREPVMKKLGYWDQVRFAADGEFKRRMLKVFGPNRIVDLKTGPLSLPRQSITSLTASAAFGYSGFFMGARKEYVESFTHYHNKANHLYYPFDDKGRLFPVPEPMWTEREEKKQGKRHFEVVIAADFSLENRFQKEAIKEINVHKKLEIKTGIVMKSCYNMIRPKELSPTIRAQINGQDVQTLVYGENITCDLLIIRGHSLLQEKQKYLPKITPHMVVVLIDDDLTNLREMSREVMNRYGKRGVWYAFDERSLKNIQTQNIHDLKYIQLAKNPWVVNEEQYKKRLKNWLTGE